jgi:hypothetical protein
MDQYESIKQFIKYIDDCADDYVRYYGKQFKLGFNEMTIEFDWSAETYNNLRSALLAILNNEE